MLPSHPDTASLGTFTTLGCAGFDQFAFEFSQTAEDSQHQPTGSGRGIGPLVPKGLEGRLMVSNGLQKRLGGQWWTLPACPAG